MFRIYNDLTVASLRFDPSEVVVEQRRLFASESYWSGPDRASHDVHPDGQRLLMLDQRETAARRSTLRVVENWFLDLKERVEVEHQ